MTVSISTYKPEGGTGTGVYSRRKQKQNPLLPGATKKRLKRSNNKAGEISKFWTNPVLPLQYKLVPPVINWTAKCPRTKIYSSNARQLTNNSPSPLTATLSLELLTA